MLGFPISCSPGEGGLGNSSLAALSSVVFSEVGVPRLLRWLISNVSIPCQNKRSWNAAQVCTAAVPFCSDSDPSRS
ncbi:hypothetical protein VTI74DRAFT_3211 [Chaetomium olivicolor]